MSNFIIGIDGGGTKTVGVLYDQLGKELKRYTAGFSNFNINYNQAEKHLYEVLDQLTVDLRPEDHLYVQMGISGYSKIRNRQDFEIFLGKKYHCQVSIESDVLIALYDVKKDLDVNVIVVIGGTGSVLMYSNNDRLEQVGGFGHLLGDEGSAYHLSIQALKDVIETFEQTQKFDAFGDAILNHLNVKDQYGIRDFVYAQDKTTVASVAKYISELALNGNQKAIRLIEDEGKHLARQTIKAYLKIQDSNKLVIALRGGFLTKAPFIRETFLNEIKMSIKDFEINESDDSPVKGAYYLSLLKLKRGELI